MNRRNHRYFLRICATIRLTMSLLIILGSKELITEATATDIPAVAAGHELR